MMTSPAATIEKDLAGRIPMGSAQRSLAELVGEIFSGERGRLRAELSGIHNPWGAASGFTDPWRFLEACEDAAVIAAVSGHIGEDVILWDSELFSGVSEYAAHVHHDVEGRYWPVEPLTGGIAVVSPENPIRLLCSARHDQIDTTLSTTEIPDGPVVIMRYMAASSHFVRDINHRAHRHCADEQILINYANRPLWLVSGKNVGDSDLITGFSPAIPTWAEAIQAI